MSILETDRSIDGDTLLGYLPETQRSSVPMTTAASDASNLNEREILYKVLFDMRSELADLKQLVVGLAAKSHLTDEDEALVERLVRSDVPAPARLALPENRTDYHREAFSEHEASETIEEVFSLQDSEKDMIRKALEKHRNRRKNAARELGISERTLYRKIKEYGLK